MCPPRVFHLALTAEPYEALYSPQEALHLPMKDVLPTTWAPQPLPGQQHL